MKKIPTLFLRNHETDHLVRDEITPGCEWVVAGEGVATVKWDGTAVLVERGRVFKRRDVRAGQPAPPHFVLADHDEVTGKLAGWVPVDYESPDDRWHSEAVEGFLESSERALVPDGTYELVGPKVQGNPERMPDHRLLRHGAVKLALVPTGFEELRQYLAVANIEGIVWHHHDGRMAKIKARDFGLRWPQAPRG